MTEYMVNRLLSSSVLRLKMGKVKKKKVKLSLFQAVEAHRVARG
jgi:hypothetical protein